MKLIKIILASFVFYLGAILVPQITFAADNNDSQYGVCQITVEGTDLRPGSNPTINPSRQDNNSNFYNIEVCGQVLSQTLGDQNSSPNYCIDNGDGAGQSGQELRAAINTSPLTWRNFSLDQYNDSTGCYSGTIESKKGESWDSSGVSIDIELDDDRDNICKKSMPVCRRVEASFDRNVLAEDAEECTELQQSIESCSFLNFVLDSDNITVNEPFTITGYVNPLLGSNQCGLEAVSNPRLVVSGPGGNLLNKTYSPGSEISQTITPSQLGEHEVRFSVLTSAVAGGGATECHAGFRVCAAGDEGCSSDMKTYSNNDNGSSPYAICDANLSPNSDAYQHCATCYGQGGIWTAIGCISQDPKNLVSKLINFGIGISGGIALLIILGSAFSLSISQGDVKKATDAKEWLTAAIIGLIFIIISVSLLEFIGSTVLRIPGFGG
ncbi:MAG: hypothetical protein GW941_02550 [Candidatus Pacebacteria bacterium]|nr:hypothetical protein [Candidatus Paceibacterota bacterium]